MDDTTIEFLWNASKLVSTNSLLQCHYLSKCRFIQENTDARLPARILRKSALCSSCSNVWMYGRCHISVVPNKMPGKKMRKLIHKQEKTPELLRPCEKALLEKCIKDKDNKMLWKCSVCKKSTRLPLTKPVKSKPIEIEDNYVETPVLHKKKKKKKKDIYAGLNSSVMSAYTPKMSHSFSKKEIKKKKRESQYPVLNSSTASTFTPHKDESLLVNERRSINYSDNLISPIKSQVKLQKKETQNLKQNKWSQDMKRLSTSPHVNEAIKVKPVRVQLAEAKQQLRDSKIKNKQKITAEIKNSAKKARKCNILQNILTETALPSSKPTLKDFFCKFNLKCLCVTVSNQLFVSKI